MEEKKVSPNRLKKQQIVAKLSDKLAKSKGLVFANYQGLTHKQLEALKKAVKPLEADLVITKNTLLLRSLQTSNFKLPTSNFEGPTATLFLYADPIEPLRQLAKTIRELNLPSIKFGIVENQVLTTEQVLRLASLPPRDILIAQFIGMMKLPIYKLHRALSWNIQRLVLTLKDIEKKKV